jgi:predicted aminopeptidase
MPVRTTKLPGAGYIRSTVTGRTHETPARRPLSGSIAARLAILAVATLTLPSCYLLKQGTSLIGFQLKAEPVDRIVAEGTYRNGDPVPQEVRDFLDKVERIRQFATDELGLAAGKNYTTFVPTDREHLAYVVSAVKEFAFDRNYWWWPLAGSFPYKGFYDSDDAVALARQMKERGYDVWVRPVDAFSTLGILHDPLFEFMVGYDTYDLANTIIHEQTHATIFVKDQVQFNEELATFVGDAGALQYLHSISAPAEELRSIDDRVADRATLRTIVFDLRARLEELYATDLDDEAKRVEKARIIEESKSYVGDNYGALFRTDLYEGYVDLPINNAYIDLFVKYTEDLSLFEELFSRLGSSVPRFMEAVSVVAHPGGIPDKDARALARSDPKAYIRTYLLRAADVDSEESPRVE